MNRERHNADSRKWAKETRNKKDHATYNATWLRANPDKRNAWNRRYKERQKGLTIGVIPFEVVELLRNKPCSYCGKFEQKKYNRTVDHYIPLSLGGLHVVENLVPSCRPCNASLREIERDTIL